MYNDVDSGTGVHHSVVTAAKGAALVRRNTREPDPALLSREELRAYLRSVSTVSLWPFTGKALGLSRSLTYSCGEIKWMRLGHLRKVSTAWLETKLFGEE